MREHRGDIQNSRELAQTLFAQLAGAVGSRDGLEPLIEEVTQVADDAPGYLKAAAASKRAAMLPNDQSGPSRLATTTRCPIG